MIRLNPVVAAMTLAAFSLTACNDPGFRGVPGVRSATDAEVTACRYVSDIAVEPGLYGPVIGERALTYARNQAMQSALESGANTVVFAEVGPRETAYDVRARAYSC